MREPGVRHRVADAEPAGRHDVADEPPGPGTDRPTRRRWGYTVLCREAFEDVAGLTALVRASTVPGPPRCGRRRVHARLPWSCLPGSLSALNAGGRRGEHDDCRCEGS